MRRILPLIALILGICLVPILNDVRHDAGLTFAAHAAEETTADALAAQIRTQGYRCDGPLSAERDAEHSKPDEAVWVLKCANATYRMRIIPDMAAKVEQLE
jgi:hypothetical protein